MLSVQVLQEFFVTVTRKVAKPLPVEDATSRIREFAVWKIFTPTAADVLAAIGLHTQAKIAFCDAMIVLAAAESGCDTLWTEDLAHGQTIRGVAYAIRSPLAVSPTEPGPRAFPPLVSVSPFLRVKPFPPTPPPSPESGVK